MKVSLRIMLYSLTVLSFLLSGYTLYTAITANYNHSIPEEKGCEGKKHSFDLASAVSTLNLKKIKQTFPYDKYLESGKYCDAASIGQDLATLNTLIPDQEDSNREIFIDALTNKLEEKTSSRFDNLNLDSLIIVSQWVDEFKTYERTSPNDGALYGIVYEHWMNFITNQLSTYYEKKPSIRFNFKFKFLQSICESKKYSPSVGKSKLQKVVEYSLEQEGDYLFNRFWHGTNFLIKLAFGILFFLFNYMIYCTYQYSFKKQRL